VKTGTALLGGLSSLSHRRRGMKMFLTAICVTASLAVAMVPDWSYYPLAVGNEWAYTSIELKVGLDSVASPKAGSIHKFRVVGLVASQGADTTFMLEHTTYTYDQLRERPWVKSVWSSFTFYVRRTASGLYQRGESEPNAPSDTELVFPFKAGDTWTIRRDGQAVSERTFVGRDSVNVPAGEFTDAWLVRELRAGALRSEHWYARDVGMVRSRIETRSGDKLFVTLHELISFRTD